MTTPVSRFQTWRRDNANKIHDLKAELGIGAVKYRDEIEVMDAWLTVNSHTKKVQKRSWFLFMKKWLVRSMMASNQKPYNKKGWKKNDTRKSPSTFNGASEQETM